VAIVTGHLVSTVGKNNATIRGYICCGSTLQAIGINSNYYGDAVTTNNRTTKKLPEDRPRMRLHFVII
jgi:hypothetical protein